MPQENRFTVFCEFDGGPASPTADVEDACTEAREVPVEDVALGFEQPVGRRVLPVRLDGVLAGERGYNFEFPPGRRTGHALWNQRESLVTAPVCS
ncbi:hypothetical protein [Haloarchaeobius sp. HRN-SO-5]|uniref:hypothetical protein n=1 Tax=Haloarchaeobius sp. HRN-SO-5 TaxID=3446118 RepID=UPI003EBA73AE